MNTRNDIFCSHHVFASSVHGQNKFDYGFYGLCFTCNMDGETITKYSMSSIKRLKI